MNHEKLEKLSQKSQHITRSIDHARQEELLAQLHQRILARQRARQAALAAALVLLALGVGLLAYRASEADRDDELAPAKTLKFADGSWIRPDAEGAVEIESASESKIRVKLLKGGAYFAVTPNKARPFEVVTKDVLVQVLGTKFSVTQRGDEVAVLVERGHVRVKSSAGELELRAGEQAQVPAHARSAMLEPTLTPKPAQLEEQAPQEDVVVAPTKPSEQTAAEPSRSKPRAKPAAIGWQEYAERGDYKEAAHKLEPADKLDKVELLMLAADTMRLAGKPQDALAYLERVSQRHSQDARAPLADFTRGRLLLDKLGRPAQAAQVFAQAQANYPKSAIAEHALAREVEAWSKAGEIAKAKAAAAKYMRLYPQGPRLQSVKLHGELH